VCARACDMTSACVCVKCMFMFMKHAQAPRMGVVGERVVHHEDHRTSGILVSMQSFLHRAQTTDSMQCDRQVSVCAATDPRTLLQLRIDARCVCCNEAACLWCGAVPRVPRECRCATAQGYSLTALIAHRSCHTPQLCTCAQVQVI